MTTVLTSSLATLLALLLGLGAAVLVVGSLLGRSVPDARRWTLAAVVITVVGLGATLPAKLRDTANALDSQRKGYAGTDERTAREKCLKDMNRPDLVDA